MPMYDYHCRACDHVYSALVLSADTPEEEIECPQCRQHDAEKLLSMKTAVLSGSGSAGHSTSAGCGCGAPTGGGFA